MQLTSLSLLRNRKDVDRRGIGKLLFGLRRSKGRRSVCFRLHVCRSKAFLLRANKVISIGDPNTSMDSDQTKEQNVTSSSSILSQVKVFC